MATLPFLNFTTTRPPPCLEDRQRAMDARKKLAALELSEGDEEGEERAGRGSGPKRAVGPSASPSIRMEDWLSKDLRLLLTNWIIKGNAGKAHSLCTTLRNWCAAYPIACTPGVHVWETAFKAAFGKPKTEGAKFYPFVVHEDERRMVKGRRHLEWKEAFYTLCAAMDAIRMQPCVFEDWAASDAGRVALKDRPDYVQLVRERFETMDRDEWVIRMPSFRHSVTGEDTYPPGVWKETTRSCRCIAYWSGVANWSKEDLDAQRWEYNHIEQGNISLAGYVYDQLKTMLAFLALLDFRPAQDHARLSGAAGLSIWRQRTLSNWNAGEN